MIYLIYFSMRVLLCTCATESCCASVGGVEWSAYWREWRERHDHQLRDAVTCLDLEWFRPVVDEHHPDISPETRIDDAGGVEDCDAVFGC